MTTSQKIKAEFIKLRKFNSIVFNFNSNKPNNAGLTGFVDWLILTPKLSLVFCEVKIGHDKLKPEQEAVLNRLSSIMGLPHSRVHYFLVRDEKQAKLISDKILAREI